MGSEQECLLICVRGFPCIKELNLNGFCCKTSPEISGKIKTIEPNLLANLVIAKYIDELGWK